MRIRWVIFAVTAGIILGLAAYSFAQTVQEAKSVNGSESEERAVNVGNKICPVSGEKINDKTKATYEYEGKIYNFCCTMCIDEFKKDPQKYIKKVEEELQVGSKGENQEMKTVSDSQKHMDMEGGHHH